MFRKIFFWIMIALVVVFAVILAACKSKTPTKELTTVVKEKTVDLEAIKEAAKGAETVVNQPVTNPQPTQGPTPTPRPGPVAILVIDDFIIEAAKCTIPTPPEGITTTDNCLYTEEGEQAYASSGAQAYASSGAQAYASSGAAIPVVNQSGQPIPHGELVYKQIYNDITNRNLGTLQTPITNVGLSWITTIDHWHIDNDRDIYLVPVDTSNYRTIEVTQRITETINMLFDDYDIQRFVLNMSFVIMPCNLGYDKAGNRIDTQTLVEEYRDLITNTEEIRSLYQTLELLANDDNTLKQPEDIVRNSFLFGPAFGPVRLIFFHNQTGASIGLKGYTRFSNDPFTSWLNSLEDDPDIDVISVAASGNYGYIFNFPFAPAIFDSVASVSASGWDPLLENGPAFNPTAAPSTDKTIYSNPGEVMDNGVLNYSIKNPAGEEMYYFGTSFAAPRLSVEEAIHFLYGGDDRCPSGSHTPISRPPLGYSDGSFDVNNLAGEWLNLPIETAIPAYCPEFRRTPTP